MATSEQPTTTVVERRTRFRALHEAGTFVLPNPYDVGSTRLLTALGFSALATTSSGFAATLGRMDMNISRDEIVHHATTLAAATDLPLNVDAERCFADDARGVAETVRLLAEAGAAGISIEDWNPLTGAIDPIDIATERVGAAAEEARRHGVVLTGRCENLLHGISDLDDTISRLCAYRDAGAEVLYAPGMVDLDVIGRVVGEVRVPINVLLFPNGPSVNELAAAGVRRVSTGGLMSHVALGAMTAAAQSLLTTGHLGPTNLLARDLAKRAFTV